MIINIWQHKEGLISHVVPNSEDYTKNAKERGWQFLGTIEINPQLPKKMVTKDAELHIVGDRERAGEYIAYSTNIPTGAKNIKCTYDIEE